MNRLFALTVLVCLALACGSEGDGSGSGGEAGLQRLSSALYTGYEPCDGGTCGFGQYCNASNTCQDFYGTFGSCGGNDGDPCHGGKGMCVSSLCHPTCVLTDPLQTTNPTGYRCPPITSGPQLSCYIFSDAEAPPVTQLCVFPNANPPDEGEPCVNPADCAAGYQCANLYMSTNKVCMLSCQTDYDCTYASRGLKCNMASAGIGFCGPWDGTYGPCTLVINEEEEEVWTCAEGECIQESERRVCLPVGCNVVTQNCPSFDSVQPACYFLSDPTTTPFDTACIMVTDPTPNQPGDACGDQPDPEHFNPSDCDKGSECIDMDDGNGNLCYAFCADNTDCTSPTTCLLFNAEFGVCACLPEDHMICGDNAVYWVDTCGILGAKVQDCSGTCSAGACVP